MKSKYINPFTDFGFKKLFGEEASKPLLLDFLNSLLPINSQIKNLSFKNTEHLGQTIADRKSLFDIYCVSMTGEKFIVELQKAKQNFFKDRTIYYSTFPIREQAEKGEWNYKLTSVFCIGILDFTFDDYKTEPEKSEVFHTIRLKNQHGEIFYDKLTYLYLEMPNFNKKEHELKTRLDQWLFFIKNLEDFEIIPTIFKNEIIFEKAFDKAELAKLDNIQWESYERSLREFRDLKNTIDYAFEQVDKAYDDGKLAGELAGKIEGKTKGIIEGKLEVAKSLKESGLSTDLISKSTGFSIEQIDKM